MKNMLDRRTLRGCKLLLTLPMCGINDDDGDIEFLRGNDVI